MKAFRDIIFAISFLTVVSACEMARFENSPGKRVEEMPNRFIGTYIVAIPNGNFGRLDTLKISFDRLSIIAFKKDELKEFVYGKDYLLYEFKGMIVIAYSDPIFKKLKNLIVLESQKKGLRAYPITEQLVRQENQGAYTAYLPYRTIETHFEPIEIRQKEEGSTFEMDALSAESRAQVGFYMMEDESFERLFRQNFLNKNFVQLNPFIPTKFMGGPNK